MGRQSKYHKYGVTGTKIAPEKVRISRDDDKNINAAVRKASAKIKGHPNRGRVGICASCKHRKTCPFIQGSLRSCYIYEKGEK